MAANPNAVVMSYNHPELMPNGIRENGDWEMELYWCFRNMIHGAFDRAEEAADDQRPLTLLKCTSHREYSHCTCSTKQLGLAEVKYICRVLEAEEEVRIWVGPDPANLKPRIPPHHWNDTRRVHWTLPVRLWDRTQLVDTINAYISGYMFSSLPHSTGAKFYQHLLEHIRGDVWPYAPESIQARFPRDLLVDDGAGVFYVKEDALDPAAKNELAKIMRGLNQDIWVVNRTGPDCMKDMIERAIPEMLPNNTVEALSIAIKDGELFVRTAAA